MSIAHSTLFVLDMTLRDGGYLNDWRFDETQIEHAVYTAAAASADFIEVGYFDDAPGLPLAASCPPKLLEHLADVAPMSGLAAMARPSVDRPDAVLDARRGLVELVRIPTDLRRPELAVALAERCRARGFMVSLNFTSASCFDAPALHAAAVVAEKSGCVDILYLADSRGALEPDQVVAVVDAVRSGWPGRIGFHAHDNLGHAEENTRRARQAGCEMIDGSIGGVGLGGRNLRLETALSIAAESRDDLGGADGLAEAFDGLGLPRPGDEMPLYRLAGLANIRQEWVVPLVERLGAATAHDVIATLPRRPWMEEHELEPYIAPAVT